MKQLILFILISSVCSCCFSQIPQSGDNIQNPHLTKFEGTWKWNSGNTEVVIMLKKVNFRTPDNIRQDVLLGVHRYTLNGVIVEDNLSLFTNLSQQTKGSIFLWGKLNNVQTDEVTGTINDNIKHKQNYLKLTYLNSTSPQLKFHISNLDGVRVQKNGDPTFDNSFTLPQDFTLDRQ